MNNDPLKGTVFEPAKNQPKLAATQQNDYDFEADRPSHPRLRERNNGPLHTTASLARFTFFEGNIRNTKPTATFNLLDAYHYLINYYAKKQTETLRAIKDPAKARRYKAQNFAYCCFCGTFATRANSGLLQPSGLICLDFDHLSNLPELKEALQHDPYFETQLLFTSPSGNGLKWVIQIEPESTPLQQFFPAVSQHIRQTYGVEPDPSGKDYARACFLPFDENAIINRKILLDYDRQ